MLISVFNTGTGCGSIVTDYLENIKLPNREDSPPEVLRGDPKMTADIIDSLDTKWKYTSGTLAWHKDDQVSPDIERQVMEEFEKIAFAGLDNDQYNILWVRHSHDDHHHLHFVIPRVELSTGKSFNPCPPGWEKDFVPFCELQNKENKWVSPQDQEHKRICTPAHADIHHNRMKRWGKEVKKTELDNIREILIEYTVKKIEREEIKNRADIVKSFEDLGLEVSRKGKDYISVKDSESEKSIRLKGGIFSENWRLTKENSRELGAGQERNRTSQDQADGRVQDKSPVYAERDIGRSSERVQIHDYSRTDSIEELRRTVEAICEKRKQYNYGRYRKNCDKIEKSKSKILANLLGNTGFSADNIRNSMDRNMATGKVQDIRATEFPKGSRRIERIEERETRNTRENQNARIKNNSRQERNIFSNSERYDIRNRLESRGQQSNKIDTGLINERNTELYQRNNEQNRTTERKQIRPNLQETEHTGHTDKRAGTNSRNIEKTTRELGTILQSFSNFVQGVTSTIQELVKQRERVKIELQKKKDLEVQKQKEIEQKKQAELISQRQKSLSRGFGR